MSKWLITDNAVSLGFITYATVPPSISSIPFSYMLGGDMVLTLIGTTGTYLISLGLTPALMIKLLGTQLFSVTALLITLVQLIVAPLAISRVFIKTGLSENIIKWRGTAINWCFFTVTYIIVGINRQVFFDQPDFLLMTILVTATVTFGLGHLIYFIARKAKQSHKTSISLMLMGTRKNAGMASAITLAFFGQRAAFPSAIQSMFEMLIIIWWGIYFREKAK